MPPDLPPQPIAARQTDTTTERATAMAITVYTKPQCVQCGATIKALDKAGLEYTLVDITADAAARDYVMALGHLSLIHI